MKFFVSLSVAACAAFAAPVEGADVHLINAPPPDETPLCGYVRMDEFAWWSVGLQTHGYCEPIWNNGTATIYRIDRDRCGCGFFVTEEDCKGKGDLVLHRGPKLEESRFMEEEKPAWVLCQELQG